MRTTWIALLGLLALCLGAPAAHATEADLYCYTGASQPFFQPASAGNPCPVTASFSPGEVTTTNDSGTITSGGTYQSIQAATATRKGCTVQNNGTNEMYVYFGAIGFATHDRSVHLSAGQSTSCNIGVSVLTDQISIDGTTADVFYAGLQ